MAIQNINIGTLANDGTGDDLREAFIKVNQNFDDLDLRAPESTTASNLGNVGEGVFYQKAGVDLQFKKLVSGANITLTASTNGITVNATGGLQQLNVVSDSGSKQLVDGDTLNIYGGTGASTSISGNVLTVDTTTELSTDLTPVLGGSLDASGNNLINGGTLTASNFVGPVTGNLTGLVHGVDIRLIAPNTAGFNFGYFNNTVTSIVDWLIAITDVDFGSFFVPEDKNFDAGSITT
ncbi:uncharacterized protein METZ01_LOCUS109758 [marine metagenome]|jgi:hypothetical protein|uniref:Uncharacterized protein n=1 Tax=marine metagenome TaxID=408172 RepID=A0A381WWM5_9ZZZZ|tara:strand:+ start:174 stop:881 length:708 start_codon:yes stop_codon:yes gene_type:complete